MLSNKRDQSTAFLMGSTKISKNRLGECFDSSHRRMHRLSQFSVGIFFLISFLCYSLVSCQSCEPYSLNFLLGSFCLGRLPYPIYRPANQTQNQAYQPVLEQIFSGQSVEGVGLSTGLATVSPQCAALVLSLICGVFVPGNISLHLMLTCFDFSSC